MSERFDVLIIGAGVVGLAIARKLAKSGREVVVLEAESTIGTQTSSRNSEVIHAGLYYRGLPLKASLCVSGRKSLYAYCDAKGVGHKRIGKLVVASGPAGTEKLDDIRHSALSNGVTDVELLDLNRVRTMEPNILCDAALWSPSTGIIDAHELMLALRADLEAHNGAVLCDHRVSGLAIGGSGLRFSLESDDREYRCRTLINSAGHGAPALADDSFSFPRDAEQGYAKGHYFSYQGKSPFRHLVYPLPAEGGLGVHATNDLNGQARFGPDVEWTDGCDYRFDVSRKPRFVESIKRWYPSLDATKLVPGYTGIRPKLAEQGGNKDFVIQFESDHGYPGLVNLLGIDSPGLTSCMAIAEYVNDRL